MNGTDDWPLAEIISIRDMQGQLIFYVHYVDCKLQKKLRQTMTTQRAMCLFIKLIVSYAFSRNSQ